MRVKTTVPKQEEVQHGWHLVDAADQPVGRLAAAVAMRLRGKHKVDYAPHIDAGDFVVVVNAAKVRLTGNKENQKLYRRYTGYPSGLREETARQVRAKHPERIVEHAVWGMLPRNRLGRRLIKRLKVYAGAEHPHAAQQPEPLEV